MMKLVNNATSLKSASGAPLLGGASLAVIGAALVLCLNEGAAAQTTAVTSVQSNAEAPASRTTTPVDATDVAATADDSEIVVTASRIERSGFEAPTPLTVIGADEIARRGATNVADVLNQVPSFLANSTPATNAISSLNAGANILNLRGLSSTRTLVLVNGRRHVPTTDTGVVDVNLIPQALLRRVEVVTGGASAAWGSDAVAGVVNFLLDDKLEGVQGSAQMGIAEEGDNREVRASLATGASFADERGHFVLAGEIFDGSGIDDQVDRDWGRDEWQVIINPAFAVGNGQPRRITSPNVRQANRTQGGLVLTGPFAGMQFAPGGTLIPFRTGSISNGQFHIGGDGINQGDASALISPRNRQTIYSSVTYELTDSVRAIFEGSFGRTNSRNPFTDSFNIGPYVIRQGNPFLPASAEAQLAPGQTFNLGRLNSDFGFLTTEATLKSYRGVAALEGRFGDDWKWSTYYQYGRTDTDSIIDNNVVTANLTRAIDAVRAPNGQITCRTTLTDATNGCVPINLFGFGSPSRAALNYVLGRQELARRTRQDVIVADLQGKPFSTWAGPVAIAVGAEYRDESVVVEVDPVSQARGFLIGNPQPLSGELSVKEVFGEVLVPLLSDAPFAKSLDVDLAARLTDYSLSGSVTTWKAGVSYAPSDSIRLRATQSRDIRAPNLFELFLSSQLAFFTAVDPRNGRSSLATLTREGNRDLRAEKADTITAGVIVEPKFAPGLRASVDFYDIKVKGAITSLGTQDIINRCFAGASELCPLVIQDASNMITSVRQPFLNVASIKTRGVDFELSHRMPFDGLFGSGPGNFSARLLATYVDELSTSDGITKINRAGDVGVTFNNGVPRWRVSGDLAVDLGAVNASLTGNYLSSGKYDANFVEGVDIDDNHIAARFYLNGSVAVTVLENDDQKVELFGVVNNILDQDPPRSPFDFQNAFYTNFSLYDVIGRNFAAGLRFKF